MPAPLLATVQDAHGWLDIKGAVADTESFLTEAIYQSQQWIESHLEVQLQKGTHVDYVHVDPGTIQKMTVAGMYPVKLSCGFLSTEVVVEASATFDGTYEAVTGHRADKLKGHLYVPTLWAGKSLRITYGAGWDSNDADEAPEALSRAIKAYIPITRAYSQYGKGLSSASLEVCRRHAEAVLSPLSRKIGTALRPIIHEYTAAA